MSSVAALLPTSERGAGATVGQTGLPFRIDHDERFGKPHTCNTNCPRPYRGNHWGKDFLGKSAWVGFNWRYDSGLVAGNAPCYGLASLDANTFRRVYHDSE